MMKILLGLLLVVVITQSTWIHILSQDELQNELVQGRNLWVVYRSRTPQFISESNQNENVLRQVGNILKGFFRVALVSSSKESVNFYGDDRSAPVPYTGEFDHSNIVDFALSQLDNVLADRSASAKELKAHQEYLEREKERAEKEWNGEQELRKKSNTILLTNQNFQVFTKSRDPFLINFYEANNTNCVELNKEWQLISLEYKGRLKVAKLNITEGQNHKLQQEIQLSKYPSVRFYKQGPKRINQYAEYTGVYKKFSISQWVNTQLSQKVDRADILPLNRENYNTLCKSTKNTCIIAFLDGSEPSDTTSQLQALALKHIKKPITFLISKKGEQDAFARQTEVAGYPDTVLVYNKLRKIWRMGELNLQNIQDTINQISLGNRNNFVRFSFTEELV